MAERNSRKNKNYDGKIKVKKGDMVLVIAGKDKGKKGKILAVDRKRSRVIVESANMVSKHQKPNQMNQSGGIIQMEAPIHISNVMYLHKDKPTRIGYLLETDSNGNVVKKRIAKTTGEVID